MKFSNPKALTTRLLAALALAVFSVAWLSGIAEAATCYTCHSTVSDLRPVESTWRNITTGSVKGSHAKHIPVATTAVSACAVCHGAGVSLYSTNHSLVGGYNIQLPNVSYTTGTSFPQSGAPVLGKCSAASCHSSPYGTAYIPSPTWSVASSCVGCHTGVGAFTGTGTSPTTGSHTKHIAASPLCVNCHAGAVAGTSGGNAHIDGNIDVIGGYTLNVTKHTSGSGYSVCTNATCHVSPYGTMTQPTTVWGAANCGACHTLVGAFTGAGSFPTTGSHTKHQPIAILCNVCHAGAVAGTSGGNAHFDGNVDVTGVGYTANVTKHTSGSGYGTCNNTACHATPYGTAPATSPTWGGAAAGCVSCHNGVGAFTGAGSFPTTGSHTKHQPIAILCDVCHAGAVAGTSGGIAHGDGNIDITGVGYTANVTKHTAGSGYSSCNNTACHATPYGTAPATSPTWGGAAAGCVSCHNGVGAFTGAGSFPTTGSHTKHQPIAVLCDVCHAGAVAGTSGGNAHGDGNIDITGVGYTANVTKHTAGSGYSSCNNTACHATPYGTAPATSPTWGGAAAGCVSCHNGVGAFTGTGSFPTTGSHTKHQPLALVCNVCHAGAVAGTSGGNAHGDSNIDVTNVGYTANVTKHTAGSGYSTCNNTTCHVSPYGTAPGTSPVWGVSGAGCGSCHNGVGAFTGAGSFPTTGSHTKHQPMPTVTCATCHLGAIAGTTGGANHGDSNIDVIGVGYTANVTKHTAGSGYSTCNNTTCHVSPYGTASVTSPTWGAAGAGCAACHNGVGAFTGAVNSPTTGSHTKHQQVVTCGTCHTGAVAGSSGGNFHTDGNIDVIGGYTANVTKHTAETGYGTCNNTTCHVNIYGTGAITSPLWGNPGAGCGNCHYGVGAFTGTGTSPTTGSHTRHQSKNIACGICHAGTLSGSTGGTYHQDGDIDVIGDIPVGYTPNVTKHTAGTSYGSCTSTSCHVSAYSTASQTSPTWGGASAGCVSCHNGVGAFTGTGSTPTTGSHTKHQPAAVCAICHSGAVAGSSGGDFHTDGNIDVINVGYTANVTKHTANTGYSTCNATTCHVNIFGTGAITSPVWGVLGAGCGNCHYGVGAFSGTGTSPTTGSHTKHQPAAACAICHTGAVAGSSGGTAHRDGNIDVVGGYTTNVTKHTAGSGYSTCNNTTCHVNIYGTGAITSPVWGALGAGCGNCHYGVGAFTGLGTNPNTGSHSRHQAIGKVCADCHTGVVAGVSGGAFHRDGNIDVFVGGYTANVTKHTANTGYTSTCNPGGACHGTATWGGPSLNCLNCHSAPITRTVGRAAGKVIQAVTTEFAQLWGHKKSGRAAVTPDDCIVCHLEGVSATGLTSSTYHKDGNIDLRDPDGAGETPITNIAGTAWTFQRFSTSFAAGSRTSIATAETIPNIISQKFCLKCHDGNGAMNTTARTTAARSVLGTQYMPFGGVNMGANYTVANGAAQLGGVINAAAMFATTNSSRHPVLGPKNKDFPTPARMIAPYNNFTRNGTGGTANKSNGVVINCFDCHNGVGTPLTLRTVTAHGNAVTLRGVITGAQPSLCITCHSGYTGIIAGTPHGTGSAFNNTPTNTHMSSTEIDTCGYCHVSTIAAVRPVRAQDLHGVNTLPTTAGKTGRWLAGGASGVPVSFVRNTVNLTNSNPLRVGATTYSPQCDMISGDACTGRAGSTYTPGGSY